MLPKDPYCDKESLLFLFVLDPTADDLIELARVELRRSEDLEKEGKLQEDEIRKRLSQLTDAPKGTKLFLSIVKFSVF